ncbi:sugar transferase [Terrilactibacillus laevilacticus]|uniref:Sugar transferase n=1 Tax=Terrilactibacillus laevilacticus TaxID=1380157 RepID=A0ABW5PMW9_9BACI|nr:sugar transferase [Terrilactibacillus laevilacticus]
MPLTKFNEEVPYNGSIKRNSARNNRIYFVFKRILDVFGALVGLILSMPLFLLIAFFYMFGEQKGPVFFKQCRIGLNGKEFYIFKFRSMVVDADKKLKTNKLLYQKYIANNYKLEPKEDPRITKFGQFLRKTSLDEIPQLINVLKGDMSLIGPRPVVEEELKEYGNELNRFLSIKPGVTGYWQVSGRSSVGYPERVDIELFYVQNQTFKLDIKILIKTISMVILRRGAY